MELRNINQGNNIIKEVLQNSIAEELGIEKGDILLAINGQEIKDIIDYKFLISDEYVEVTIEKQNGEVWDLEIEKGFDEELGIVFTNPLIDKAKSCRNKCIFCFIDQLPEGMRKTLYFKDDDSRLSFLQGNFITLTNMSDDEIDRIIKYRLSPINISVHTTDPELRIKMLNNKNAGKIFDILQRFNDASIEMNCQIVLVPGINDGENLDRTLKDLSKLYPNVASVAVVPVGVTQYRDGLFELDTYNKQSSKLLLEKIKDYQQYYIKKFGSRFVYAADEFYVLADEDIPAYENYEGFPQLENGVGLMRLFWNQIEQAIDSIDDKISVNKEYVIATGTLAYDFMVSVSQALISKFEGLKLKVVPIKNKFFGEKITVSGLVTGRDLLNQLKGIEIKDGVIIPKCMLKSDEDIFLDDVTVKELEKKLNTKIIISEVDGKSFVDIFK
ncbi:DUF512 domain-containing protein [Caldisalinibacter kiritimatiensis]|uniref:Fe-S oxidoreductase n=1 Tax=Caldisalinibacter kiritimatiensis TaxID=1304284 RepID=R1CXC5_9FIRM|nr:DUF512 domain-containing protein [Caldisalinibacter kiritimatiensis]EOD01279.1 Fe-S oxidoreductase [Caldisalinibacter kiritimatiensis]